MCFEQSLTDGQTDRQTDRQTQRPTKRLMESRLKIYIRRRVYVNNPFVEVVFLRIHNYLFSYNGLLLNIVWHSPSPWSVIWASFVMVPGLEKWKIQSVVTVVMVVVVVVLTCGWWPDRHRCSLDFFKSTNHKISKTHFRLRVFNVYTDSLPSRVSIAWCASPFSCI